MPAAAGRANGENPSTEQRAPTDYFCIRTNQGRIAIYRVEQAAVQYPQPRTANVSVVIEDFVWGSPLADGQMGAVENGINFNQGDLYDRPASTPQQCSQICYNDERCVAMTFIPDQQRCWVKNAVDSIAFNPGMASALRRSH